MPLNKVKHGLLEEDNFYLTSSVTDFLGNGIWSRTDGEFILKSGTVKRRLPYRNFVIDVKKKASGISESAYFEFFIEYDNGKLGIREEYGNEPVTDWRIIYYEGFIQIYVSEDDGLSWQNKGGADIELEGDIFQGFSVKGEQELIIMDYKLYCAPYLIIQNFRPGSFLQLIDADNNIRERIFDENYECSIFLNNQTLGRVKVFENENLIYESKNIKFIPGDVFLFSEKSIQLIYNEKVLDYNTTQINQHEESLTIKNAGDEDVFDIHIEVINKNKDAITLSFDGEIYYESLHVERLLVEEEMDFLVKIEKSDMSGNFFVKNFDINIY